eukprot:CAMPEP_0196656972 /NCGR_PEP_ID=MMETSP1086-20130531/20822_1 /TAXON_ID=77921 /ORGANISM="Cyanoptyche  gloeocystis , Strain SAG4.97" /LENGTH=187 /DNA_ID=CAMNT_0041989927 /DNA_START=130 /DNA_END=693 /DNA_ORIENTATION=-
MGSRFQPYTVRLRGLLEGRFGPEKKFQVVTEGIPGDMALDMPIRLEESLERAATLGYKYQWALFLGGTNDMMQGVPAHDIASSLATLHRTAYAHGARTVAITIPECSFEDDEPHITALRTAVNDHMRRFADESNGATLLLDLAALIPWASMPPDERRTLWDDGVHFSAAGYDRIGTLLYEVLKNHIN